jgi:hypothetical protein
MTLRNLEKTSNFFGCVCVEGTRIAMPKQECTVVYGHAPRKALGVKKVSKKVSGKTTAKKRASDAAPKKAAPAAPEVESADEHVSASPTPPTPSSPRSPRYEREPWWDSFGALSRRIDDTAKVLNDLKECVKRLEEQCEKDRAAGSVFGKGG